MMRYNLRLLLPLFLTALAWSCSPDGGKDEPLPDDAPPAVRRLAPAQPTALASPGETVRLQFLLTDNERLAWWEVRALHVRNIRLVDTVVAVNGRFIDTTLVKGDTFRRQVLTSEFLTGRRYDRVFEYQTPFEAEPFSHIVLRTVVADSKEHRDSTDFDLAVDLARVDTLAAFFKLLRYEGDTLFAKKSTFPQKAVFNLIARNHPLPDNIAAQDMAEDGAAGSPFAPRVMSPAGQPESTLVVLPPTAFNFDAVTYSTMRAAFYAHSATDRTPILNIEDVVIIRLNYKHATYKGYYHFAAVRIRSIVTDPDGNHYFIFDYKRSYDA